MSFAIKSLCVIVSLLLPVALRAQSLQIAVTPEQLVLGESSSADVEVKLPSIPDAPCRDLRMQVNTGSIVDITQSSFETYTAKYLLPEDFFPRFGLLAATATCGTNTVSGIAVVKLYGSGNVEVKARPFSKVTLNIAQETFGPRMTNAQGIAIIPIVVPPGVFTGIAGDKTIDLNLPAANRIVAIAAREAVDTKIDQPTGTIWIYAIDERGFPLATANFKAEADKGEVRHIDIVAPGIYKAHYLPPKKIGDGNETVSITLSGDAVSNSETALQLLPGPPDSIHITTAPKQYAAGTDTPVAVTVKVLDKNGNETDGDFNGWTDTGELSLATRLARGNYEMTLVIPNEFSGKQDAAMRFRLKSNHAIEASTTIPLVPDSAKEILITEVTDPIPADGLTQILIPVVARDRFGNPIRDINLELSTTAGETPSMATPSDDGHLIPFTPPLGSGAGHAKIKVSDGEVSAETAVQLTDKTYWIAASPGFGFVSNFSHMNAPYFLLGFDVNLWFLLRGLHVTADVGYYFSRGRQDSESITSTAYAIPIVFSAGYRYYILPRLFLGGSVGFGVHILRNRNDGPDGYTTLESAGQFGFHFRLTVGFRAGIGDIITQLGWIQSKPSKVTTLSGNMGGLALLIGYRFTIF